MRGMFGYYLPDDLEGKLFNLVSDILKAKYEADNTHVYFSSRLACTQGVLGFIDGWYEQWKKGKAAGYIIPISSGKGVVE